MSAFIIDPRSIDYLVAWVRLRTRDLTTAFIWERLGDVPEGLRASAEHSEYTGAYRLNLRELPAASLGALLMAENIRSVRYRYDDCPPDDLPGPVNQSRIWRYEYRPVPPAKLRPDWVVSTCDCLRYQSCEVPDYLDTPAFHVLDTIRESAIAEWTDGCPWDLSEADVPHVATHHNALSQDGEA